MNFIEDYKPQLKRVGTKIKKADMLAIESIINNQQESETFKKVGSGCFGNVYRYEALNGDLFAVKVSRKYFGGADEPSAHDIETLLDLQGHEYILNIHAYDNSHEKYFVMVVDYVDGVTALKFELPNMCKDHSEEFKVKQIKLIENFEEAYEDTVEYIQSKGYRIDDMHMQNIMVSYDGKPYIVDFGAVYKSDNTNSFHARRSVQKMDELVKTYKRRALTERVGV